LPEPEFAALAAALPEGVVLERYRPDFPQILRRCRVSVGQAGYNTVLDILAARAAAVVVPFASGHETGQRLRGERLAAGGSGEGRDAMVAGRRRGRANRTTQPVTVDRVGSTGVTCGDPC